MNVSTHNDWIQVPLRFCLQSGSVLLVLHGSLQQSGEIIIHFPAPAAAAS